MQRFLFLCSSFVEKIVCFIRVSLQVASIQIDRQTGSSMVREKDVCWEYCEKLDGNKVRCNFCQKILNGGISRLKHHLSRVPSKGVNPCGKVRDEVSERVKSIIQSKEEGKEAASAKKQRLEEASRCHPSPHIPVKDPLPLAITGSAPLSSFFSGMDAERSVAQFFFENRLDFSVAHSPSYRQMMESLGGSGFRGPSAEALKTTWLEKIKSEVNSKIKEIESEWGSTGCTIIADTWPESNKSKTWINFFVSSPSGTFFHKSVDALSFKNAKHVSDLFDSVILSVGPENVVQILVDDALGYMSVGNYIMQKYSSIFWSPCASRCLSLILEDFCKIDWVSRCILQAQSVTRFIYNNSWMLALMKKFTGGQEIIRTSAARSVSNFLSLQCLVKHRSRIKQMFNSPEYSSSPYASRPHGMVCAEILEDNQFWRAAEEAAAVSEPLLKVLREVSGNKPAIGTLYESMTKAKDSIRTYYIMDEAKCKIFLEIVDKRWQHQLHSPLHAAAAYLNPSIQYNPEAKFLGSIKEEFHAVLDKLLPTQDLRQDITTQIFRFRKAQGMFGSNLAREARSTAFPGMWWEQYGDSAPGLQHVAIRVLSQICSAGAIDRSFFSGSQQIHPEKKNKLERETFNDFVYVHCNLKVQSRGKLAEADPILLEDVDMSSEWVEEIESGSATQWLDRFSSSLDGGDLNSRQFNGSIFGSNDHLFNL